MSIDVPVGTVIGNGVIAHVLGEPLNVSFDQFDPLFQPGEQSRVAGRGSANGLGANASKRSILFDATDDAMRVHAAECAKWHTNTQELSVPNATLNGTAMNGLRCGMASDFRHALLWHMDKHETKIADLVKETGISRDVINKLRARENSSTTAENALLIASYYGKTLEQFIRCDDARDDAVLTTLAGMLRPEEAEMLEAQLRGILASRGQR